MLARVAASALVAAVLAVAPADAGTLAAPAEQASILGSSACFLAVHSGWPPAISGGSHPETDKAMGDACELGSCWSKGAGEEGTEECTYSRGALLTLGRYPSARAAQVAVGREIAKGYRTLHIRNADLAGFVSNSNLARVLMAVGKTTALIALSAHGPKQTDASFAGVKEVTVTGAKDIARRLRKAGCPLNTGACI
jgi:hypothetical protein